MDSVKPSAMKPAGSKLARTFAKVLHLRMATGVAPVDGKKVKPKEMAKKDWNVSKSAARAASRSRPHDEEEEELKNKVALEAVLAKLFASISSIKAAYAQLQHSQSPYDADGIQAADKIVVSELKSLSELKQSYSKKLFDASPEKAMVLAEIHEQKSVLKTYEIMGKKLESQLRLKDSEMIFLKEKLQEATKQNRSLEKRLNQSGQLHVLDNLHHSGLTAAHFITLLRLTVKSIRSFVRLMVEEMKDASWDIDAAANAIVPGVVYRKDDHKCFAFESFVCMQMFESFNYPYFSLTGKSLPDKKQEQQLFFRRFMELKSVKLKAFLGQKLKSKFAKFCLVKYVRLVNPKLESSLFGNLDQRNLVNVGEFPNTAFFASFLEMARRIWLLHCLAFSFKHEASIFQVSKGCRFSEVYMESVAEEEAFLPSDDTPESDPSSVAFTVVPGFRIDETVIQCQVYLSRVQIKVVSKKQR
ncbi:hypothetical protein I3760_12G109200 [Carya illinoinensis]|nr:hypothetical protein I3760_12G109200 [Carya illinoinensis]KAG2677703.1 hypothetical protein I3760_12G109200 [Carya illinoinensis]